MYELIDQVNHYLQIFLVFLVLACIIIGACYIYYANVMKKKRISEDEIDYSHLDRADAADYIKFDDIKDGMIILNKGRRFVGVVRCQASKDFYAEQASEQASVAQNFLSFIGTIDKPVTYRQYCQSVDLEDTVNAYQEQLANREKELYNAVEDRKEMIAALKTQELNKDEIAEYNRSLERIDRKIESLKIRKFHIEDQIHYIKQISGNGVDPTSVQTWVFEWVYDPLDFSIDLSDDEIYKRALQELHSRANAIIHSLSNCDVKAFRCSTEELIEMCRRYSCPVSAERFKLRDVVNSSFFDDVNTSDCVDEMLDEAARQNVDATVDMYFDSIANSLLQAEANDSPERKPESDEESTQKNSAGETKSENTKKKNVARRVKKRPRKTDSEKEVTSESALFLDD